MPSCKPGKHSILIGVEDGLRQANHTRACTAGSSAILPCRDRLCTVVCVVAKGTVHAREACRQISTGTTSAGCRHGNPSAPRMHAPG